MQGACKKISKLIIYSSHYIYACSIFTLYNAASILSNHKPIMNTILCKVLDHNKQSVPGVHVLLDCEGHVTYQSITDRNGDIQTWYPFPLVGRTERTDSRFVFVTPNFGLSYTLPKKSPTEANIWYSMTCYLEEPGPGQLLVVLYLPKEHTTECNALTGPECPTPPKLAPNHSFADKLPLSPLQLPSPVYGNFGPR